MSTLPVELTKTLRRQRAALEVEPSHVQVEPVRAYAKLIAAKCPRCDCDAFETVTYRTADGHSPWQDTDGSWYSGPAVIDTKRTCANCGWSQKIVRKRGKLDSVVSDPV